MKSSCVLLIVSCFVFVSSQYSRSKSEYRTCYYLVGNKQGECSGRHCYKMTTQSNGTNIIKKGCLNVTDTPSSIGTCDTIRSESNDEETWCLCNDKERCNSATGNSIVLGLFVSLMYLLI